MFYVKLWGCNFDKRVLLCAFYRSTKKNDSPICLKNRILFLYFYEFQIF